MLEMLFDDVFHWCQVVPGVRLGCLKRTFSELK